MSTLIRRDAGHPFDPTDPGQLDEFQGFGCDVPTTDGMIAAVRSPLNPANTPANARRAAKLFVPGLIPAGALPGDDLPTPDRVTPNVNFGRQGLHDLDVAVPGMTANGGRLPVWSFQDILGNVASWPAPTIRVREGQIVHSFLNSRQGPHTIHHHGIEPTPMNDGVGHLTFEVGGGGYTYQWRAGEAGTYFYHCHRNTVLHFEMGMYGALIIDPPEGQGVTFVGNTLTPYGVEKIWVADDFDTRWHGLANNGTPPIDHVASGIAECGPADTWMAIDDPDNPELHRFNPNVFVVSGVAAAWDPARQRTMENAVIAGAATATVTRGQPLLLRTLNASYCTQRWQFPSTLSGRVIAQDGRTLGREPFGRYSAPFTLASIGHRFELSTARRWDILIDTSGAAAGTHYVEIGYYHWITNVHIQTVRVPIVVAV